MSTYQLFTS